MEISKKNSPLMVSSKKTINVTKTKVVVKSAAFAGKIRKVNKLLDKTKWLKT